MTQNCPKQFEVHPGLPSLTFLRPPPPNEKAPESEIRSSAEISALLNMAKTRSEEKRLAPTLSAGIYAQMQVKSNTVVKRKMRAGRSV